MDGKGCQNHHPLGFKQHPLEDAGRLYNLTLRKKPRFVVKELGFFGGHEIGLHI